MLHLERKLAAPMDACARRPGTPVPQGLRACPEKGSGCGGGSSGQQGQGNVINWLCGAHWNAAESGRQGMCCRRRRTHAYQAARASVRIRARERGDRLAQRRHALLADEVRHHVCVVRDDVAVERIVRRGRVGLASAGLAGKRSGGPRRGREAGPHHRLCPHPTHAPLRVQSGPASHAARPPWSASAPATGAAGQQCVSDQAKECSCFVQRCSYKKEKQVEGVRGTGARTGTSPRHEYGMAAHFRAPPAPGAFARARRMRSRAQRAHSGQCVHRAWRVASGRPCDGRD